MSKLLHLVVIFSAPMPTSYGGLVVMTSIRKTRVQSLARTQIIHVSYMKHVVHVLCDLM